MMRLLNLPKHWMIVKIQSINSELTELPIPIIDFSLQMASIQEAILALNKKTDALKHANSEVQSILEKEKIEGDPITLLQKVDGYRSEIEKEKETIRQIDEKSNKLQSLIESNYSGQSELDKKRIISEKVGKRIKYIQPLLSESRNITT
nr:hypothetical protein [Microcystis aeruginosa G11-01]